MIRIVFSSKLLSVYLIGDPAKHTVIAPSLHTSKLQIFFAEKKTLHSKMNGPLTYSFASMYTQTKIYYDLFWRKVN